MAQSPQCIALNNAMKAKNVSYAELARRVGKTEQHIIDVCTGTAAATEQEFDALARALDIKDAPTGHKAQVTK